jgi:hypothetical protein
MKQVLKPAFCIGVLLASLSYGDEIARPATAKFPRVSFVKSTAKSKVMNLKDPEKSHELKKNDVLTERAKIVTAAGSEVRLDLDPYSSVIIYENSELEIPVITWGEGEAPTLNLEKGRVFVSCEKDCTRVVKTPLSQNVFTNGVYILEYNRNSPYVELIALHGGQDFRGLENEESVHLDAGQKVTFQGLKENEEVAYDILLKGRKVARGKLQPVITLKPEEVVALEAQNKKLLRAVLETQKKKTIPRKPGQICDAPFGELNQCSWVCEGLKKNMKTCNLEKSGVSCIRRRCNANGVWDDPTPLTKLNSRCERQPVVGACDY